VRDFQFCEQHVVDHEFGHGLRALSDPLASASDTNAEKLAEDFAKQVESEPNTMSPADAEKRVREIFDLPPLPPKPERHKK
jgi:hypothetical protein